MNNKKKQTVLMLIALFGLIVVTAGVTYAFFSYAKEGTTDNTVTTGTITFLYTEVSGVGKGISIDDAYPISDTQGKAQTGEGKVFDFKITSNNNVDASIPYEVTARKKTVDNMLDEDAVKIYLTKVSGDTEEEVLLSKYSDLDQTDKVLASDHVEKTIYNGKVPANQTEKYEQNFRLRMWIDKDVNFSQLEDGTYPYNDKSFTITVNVYANAKVVTDEDIQGEAEALISTLTVGGTELTKVEDQAYDYETKLPEGTTQTTIDIETQSPYATVEVERLDSLAYTSNVKRLSTKKTLELFPGNNYFKITVISENKEVENEYKLNIKVAQGETLLSKAIFNQYPTIYENATLDKTSSEVNENGLFKSTATNFNGVEGTPTYYFRGNVENYVDFAGFTWRVVRINEDGTVRLILQDAINNKFGYSINPTYSTGYTYMYYSNSNVANGAKYILDNWFNTNIANNQNYSNKVISGNYFCEEAKVGVSSKTVGNATIKSYNDLTYTPSFTCNEDGNQKGLVETNIGLLTYDELVHAGGYYKQSNNDCYLKHDGATWWTMSPAGTDFYDYPLVWYASTDTNMSSDTARMARSLRPVINLKSTVTVTGTGTSDDHWVVQ